MTLIPKNNFVGHSILAAQKMTEEELLFIFIPMLIFEAGYNSDLFM